MFPFDTLYEAFITPHFNYCSESWLFCSKRATEKLEKLNERSLRFVWHDHSSSNQTLLSKSGQTTLANQRLSKILSTVFKIVNYTSDVNSNEVPVSLLDLINLIGNRDMTSEVLIFLLYRK